MILLANRREPPLKWRLPPFGVHLQYTSKAAFVSAARPIRTFVALALSVASFASLQSLLMPVLPLIQDDLHTTSSAVTWTVTAWLITAAVATPLFGRIGDMIGKRRMFVISVGAIAVGSLIAAFAPSLEVLILARVLQGFAGAIFPLTFGIIRDEFPTARVPAMIGMVSAVIAVGSGLGTVLSGPLADLVGWRGVLLVFVAMAAMKEHALPHEKVNIHGGACALGHPVGASGARIIVTLMNALDKVGGKRGIASLCIGGGEATAVAIERIN